MRWWDSWEVRIELTVMNLALDRDLIQFVFSLGRPGKYLTWHKKSEEVLDSIENQSIIAIWGISKVTAQRST